MKSNTCYIGLGSNLGNPVDKLQAAIDAIARIDETELSCHSSFYKSPPWGRTDQPDFVNAVAAVATSLDARKFLEHLFAIETAMGRRRNADKWGPRIIDLDLLLFGDEVYSGAALKVPHPLMHERAFVLVPLVEIAPDCEIPGKGRADYFLEQLGTDAVNRIIRVTEENQSVTEAKER